MDELNTGLFLLRFAGPVMGWTLVSVFGTAALVLYIMARWRANRQGTHDPQLGMKFALHFFAGVGLHASLMGAVVLLHTIFRQGGDKSTEARIAVALLLPSIMVCVIHLALLTRTNDKAFPVVRRLFTGFNLLICGLLGFISLLAATQALFIKGNSGGLGHMAGASLLVYLTAWGLLAWRMLRQATSDPWDAAAGPPGQIVSPGQSPPPSAQGASGLPSLGGGWYPPVEPPHR